MREMNDLGVGMAVGSILAVMLVLAAVLVVSGRSLSMFLL